MNKKYKVLKDFKSLGFVKDQIVLITQQTAEENPKHFKEIKDKTGVSSADSEVKEEPNAN